MAMEIALGVGESRGCIAVIILEDKQVEENEIFSISVSGFSTSTNVMILDDDGICAI